MSNKMSVSTDVSMSSMMRMYAIVAYFTIIVVIGVPLWWKTTEVYRVSLPYSRIEELSSSKTKVRLRIFILSEKYVQFENELRKHLSVFDECNFTYQRFAISTAKSDQLNSASTNQEAVDIFENEVDTNQLLLIENPHLNVHVWFGNGRTILVKEASEKTIATLSSALQSWLLLQRSSGTAKTLSDSALHILMTLVVPRPDEIKLEWDSRLVMEQYIRPLANELSNIYNFTLKSQRLYLTELDFNAKQVTDDTEWGRHYAVSESRLTHVVTPLETKLAAQVALPPKNEALALLPATLNLVMYIPPCQTAPIAFYSKKGKLIESIMPAFISPKWGGVLVMNPSYEACINYMENVDIAGAKLPIFKPKAIQVMGIFLTQLRTLLGLKDTSGIQDADIAPLKSILPRRWELDALKRRITLEQISTAKLTLKSLAKLLGEISNIVINDEIGELVYTALDNIEKSSKLLDEGQLDLALKCSKRAFHAAETAFMDPSLLSLLYFPDDQKYAVYIPLFLPVMIPVLMSMKAMFTYFFKISDKQKID